MERQKFQKLSLDLRAKKLAAALKANQPAPGRYADGRNLYLNVTASGAKSWLFIWLPKGAKYQRECGLGSATGAGSTVSLTLTQARAAADLVRAQIAAGIDPIAAKAEAKVAAIVAETTLADTLALHIRLNKGDPMNGGWSVKHGVCGHAKDMEGKLNLHAAKLMATKTAKITVQDVLAVLEPIWAKDVGERVRYILEQVFATAIGNDQYKGANPAQLASVVAKLGVPHAGTGKNQPSLAFAKLPAAVATLLATGRMDAIASVFCTLTGTRSDEARLMKWEEINWAEKLWTVPAWRMKVKTKKDQAGEHLVPLSDAAIALLKDIVPVVGNDYVFAGKLEAKPVAEGSLNVTIAGNKRKGGILLLAGEATQHGMRSTFSTWANDGRGYAENDVERCIAHVVGTKVSRVYNKAERLAERREIMQAWGEACMGRAASNVVPMKAAA